MCYKPGNRYNSEVALVCRRHETIPRGALQLSDLKNKQLEIYYNGECGLTGFVINRFTKECKYWKNIGQYTTDFLYLQDSKNILSNITTLNNKINNFFND